ncbi:hypothetical protein [Methylosinus sp. Ce-a6]|uniref:hypothetical protein n=1 Tax=Methylosinus sp. Ce-a6 TaxID=2172005 RepID=UPI0013575FE7|nr:hypothetical protein [Methylosinus sp. Ce-a6]
MTDDSITEVSTARPATVPENFVISLRGFDAEERARALGAEISSWIHDLSRIIDLRGLDGITIDFDYKGALRDLDRGRENLAASTPTDDVGVGIAMTPSVIREGKVKSHIVLDAFYMLGLLEDNANQAFEWSLHTLAHECAHVELTSRFDAAFPNVILQRANKDVHEAFRWQVILACWDEYGATRIASRIGYDPTTGYEDTFVSLLETARSEANDLIKLYREHGNVSRIMAELYNKYGTLLKYSCYHLGNLAGFNVAPDEREKTRAALKGHWFAPYFIRLESACKTIWDNFGNWTDQALFEVIGDIVDDVVREGGAVVTHRADGTIHINIPYTIETMPASWRP